MTNLEYLILNLDCGYRVKHEAEEMEIEVMEEKWVQEDGIINIFFMPNESVEITKI